MTKPGLRLLFTDDPKQALRMRSFLMAAAMYLVSIIIDGILAWHGYVSLLEFLMLCGGVLVINAVFFVLLRSGANLRFRDPSLTFAQILAATIMLGPVSYYAGEARGAILMIYLVAFLFGVLRLNMSQFLQLGAAALINYAGVILMVSIHQPEAFDARLEAVQWLTLALVMPAYAMLGGYMSAVRQRLRATNRELEEAFARIREMAIRDDLTGLHNRGHLMELMRNEQARVERTNSVFSVCMIDIDHFKEVNDTYGHPAGDRILRHAAHIAQAEIRASDAVGRYGGEEFVILTVEAGAEQAARMAERIRREIERARFPDIDPRLRITISAGVAQHIPPEDHLFTIKRADQALYQAKHLGRNRVCQAPTEAVGVY